MNQILVHVTEHNHDWVSEMTGLSLEEIAKHYQKSIEDDVVCILRVSAIGDLKVVTS